MSSTLGLNEPGKDVRMSAPNRTALLLIVAISPASSIDAFSVNGTNTESSSIDPRRRPGPARRPPAAPGDVGPRAQKPPRGATLPLPPPLLLLLLLLLLLPRKPVVPRTQRRRDPCSC